MHEKNKTRKRHIKSERREYAKKKQKKTPTSDNIIRIKTQTSR